MDKFNPETATFSDRDLTVVYAGYNDIKYLSGSLGQSLSDLRGQIDRLIEAGATEGEARLFLTLLHDWGSNPSYGAGGDANVTREVEDWNTELAKLANHAGDEGNNVVAVDLYSVFKRIQANPAAYGFDNIESPEPDKADSTALYFDENHFGPRGQEIIYQVFRHYLTRGWDWANGFAGADEADEALDAAIKKGYALAKSSLGFASFAVGAPAVRNDVGADPSRAGFAALRTQDDGPSGLGVSYGLQDGTNFGVAFTRSEDDKVGGYGHQVTRLSQSADATTFFLDTKVGGVQLATQARIADEHHVRRENDTLVGGGSRAAFDGQTVGLSQTAGVPLRAGNAWLTPWVNLSHAKRSVDGFTIANAYLSDVTYGAAQVEETYTTLGLDLAFDPLPLGGDRVLNLKGTLAYKRSLHLDDYEVRITEAAFGNTERARMGRDAVGVLGLDVGAALDLGENLSFDADYGLAKQTGAEVEQNPDAAADEEVLIVTLARALTRGLLFLFFALSEAGFDVEAKFGTKVAKKKEKRPRGSARASIHRPSPSA